MQISPNQFPVLIISRIYENKRRIRTPFKNKKFDNPLIILIKLLHLSYILSGAHKTTVFCWITSHIAIHGNEKVDIVAKELFLV